jgi:hypothetical protein
MPDHWKNYCMSLKFGTVAEHWIRGVCKTPQKARFYSRFFFFSMLLACAAMGALHVPSEVMNLLNRGHGNNSLGVRASLQLLSFTGQRRSPAL